MYFLLGELPIEASLHLDILSLFWNICPYPQTKIYEVLEYLLLLLDGQPSLKEIWKQHVKAAVVSHHE